MFFGLYLSVFIKLCAFAVISALFEQCNHVVELRAGQKIFINSPYYPLQYPAGSSCRYTVKAPLDHELLFKCNIQLNTPPSPARCQNEVFYFNREGSELLTGSEYFCGSGSMERRSFLNRAVISYISTLPAGPTIAQHYHRKGAATKLGTAGAAANTKKDNKVKKHHYNSNSDSNTNKTANSNNNFEQQKLQTSNENRNKQHIGNNIVASHNDNSQTVTTSNSNNNNNNNNQEHFSTEVQIKNEISNKLYIENSDYNILSYNRISNTATNNHYYAHKGNNKRGNNYQTESNKHPQFNNNNQENSFSTENNYYTLPASGITNTIATTTTTTSTNHGPTVDSIPVAPKPEAGVSGALAYVAALLTNTFQSYNFFTPATTTTATTRPAEVTTTSATLLDLIPTSLWRNGSTSDWPSSTDNNTSSKRYAVNRRGKIVTTATEYVAGGGSFSCLVEVIEPQCDCGWSTVLKVSGPSNVAAINEFPSMAGVMTVKYNRVFCGAAIIHHHYLLSAAHCFITPSTNRSELIRVVVGEHDLSTMLESVYTRHYDIESIIPHEHFRTTATTVRNDIALLRTRLPIEWNRGVAPACLPFRSITGTDGGRKPPIAGQLVVTAGWGTTSFGGPQSTLLLKTTLDVIATDQCKRVMRTVPPATFCTYTPGRDTCQYDSGGALYARDERLFAVGIVSYGFACAAQQPSVNTKVASFIRWIKNRTPEVKYCIK